MCIIIKKYKLQENINKELLLEIAKITFEENVYVSTIQRKLSVGFAVATQHLDWLLSNKFVSLDAEGKTYSMNKKQYNKILKAKFEQ